MSIEPIVINKNGYKIVDPNPPGSVVDHEDLFTFVKLEAKTAGKSFITKKEDKPKTVVENLNFSSIDLTTGPKKPFLTTKWTEIGGSQFSDNIGNDLEGFGITNIDIKIQGSYIPQVTIDFVDVRGATLFEQGSCSPYGVFFHLPYPVFELTVKGYYGKPVKYFLNLTKFNTKFNAETGNFECRGEFIGWSYAFLADMLLGFIAATPYMKDFDTKSKLKNTYETIYDNYRKNELISDSDNPFIIGENPITIVDFLKKIKDLEVLFGKIKNTDKFNDLENLNKLKKGYNNLTKETNLLVSDLIEDKFQQSTTQATPLNLKYRLEYTSQKIDKKIITKIISTIKTINTNIEVLIENDIQKDLNLSLLKNKNILDTISSDWTNIITKSDLDLEPTDKNIFLSSKPFIDLGYIILQINNDLDIINKKLETERKDFKDRVNDQVTEILGIKPTVRNVLTILNANTEVFMDTLLDCAERAERYHESNNTSGTFVENRLNNKSDNTLPKIYPWPTYYEESSKPKKTLEKFPGDNTNYLGWWEVRFVEDFLKALTRLNQEFKEISVDEKTGIPGFDFFLPIITPLESKYFDGNSEISYTQLDTDQTGNDFEKIFKDRLFTLFHHTLMDPVFTNNINVGLGYNPTVGKELWLKNKYPQISSRGVEIIQKIAAVDTINLLNTIKSENVLQKVKISVDNLVDSVKKLGIKKLSEINKNYKDLLNDNKKLIIDDEYYIYNESEINFKNNVIIKPNWYEMEPTHLFQILDVTPPTGYNLNRYDEVKLKDSVDNLLKQLNDNIPSDNLFTNYFNLDENSISLLLYDEKFKLFHDLTLDGEKDKIKKTLGTFSTVNTVKYLAPKLPSGVNILVPNNLVDDCLPTMEVPKVGIFKNFKAYVKGGVFQSSNNINTPEGKTTLINEIEKSSSEEFEDWSDATIFDTLTMSPLWLDNVKRFRKIDFKKPNQSKYNDEQIECRNLAYLFLSSCRPNPLIINLIKDKDRDKLTVEDTKPLSLEPFYKIGGVVKSPKLWVLGMGATLWRWKMFMGELTDSERNIRPGFTWKHPLFGDSPTGVDPLAQPHHPLNFSKKRFSSVDILTNQFGQNVNNRTQTSIFKPTNLTFDPKTDVLSVAKSILSFGLASTNTDGLAKKINKDLDKKELVKYGYAFDYWGVYMNDPILTNNQKRYINYFGKEFYKTWEEYLNFVNNKKWIGGGDLDKLYDKIDNVKEFSFKTVEDAKNRTSYPGLYITPWQHFYYRNDLTENNGGNLNSVKHHNIIIMQNTNSSFNGYEYTSSFIGNNWFGDDKDNQNINEKIEKIKGFDYKFIYYNNSSANLEGRYGDMIALLPDFVKDSFVKKFEDWCDTIFKDNLLKKIDPVNFSTSENNLLAESYVLDTIGNEKLGDYIYEGGYPLYNSGIFGDDTTVSVLTFNDTVAETIYTELFDSYYYIINSTPKIWNSVYQEFNNFVANKKLVDKYIEEFKKVFNANYNTVLNNLRKEEIQDESVFGESALDDGDIKLSLYRTFKSITDKWISGSSSKDKKFFNVVGEQEGDDRRTLSEHFSFVTRTMKDIGDEAIIDPTVMLQVTDNPKMSLYNLIVDILKENNFDFFPLPTFSNFTNNRDEELKEMFKPLTEFKPVKGGPNFICMYVGGTSRGLDIQPPVNINCPIDVTELTNPNDGFNLSDDGQKGVEYEEEATKESGENRIENAGFTAFKVAYGAENQNHFRSVQLDQSEFTETNESLLIIEKLSQGGDSNNRSLKGNNLHNIYLTRSYSCTVESLGNMQIQPLQYFELTNIPMFRGTYLITEVSHNIKPHFVGTSFKGVRQPLTTVPIVTDILSIMKLSFNDAEASQGDRLRFDDVVGTKKTNRNNNTENTNNNYKTTFKPGTFLPIIKTIINNGGTNGDINKGNIVLGSIPQIEGVADPLNKLKNTRENKLIIEAVEPLVQMLKDFVEWSKSNGFKGINNKFISITSIFRDYAKQEEIKKEKGDAAATPGNSNHGWGIAVDLQFYNKNGGIIKNQENTREFFDINTNPAIKWMYDNSYKYGWLIPYNLRDTKPLDEHWHFEYHGKSALCLIQKNPTIYGYAVNTSSPVKPFVKNPQQPSGGEDIYSDCDGQFIKTAGDGTENQEYVGNDKGNRSKDKVVVKTSKEFYTKIGKITT